jgi:hypothetical protein
MSVMHRRLCAIVARTGPTMPHKFARCAALGSLRSPARRSLPPRF